MGVEGTLEIPANEAFNKLRSESYCPSLGVCVTGPEVLGADGVWKMTVV